LVWDDRSLHHMKHSFAVLCFCETVWHSFAVLCFYETVWHSFAVLCFYETVWHSFTLSSCQGPMWQNFAFSSCHGPRWLGTFAKGSSQTVFCLATPRLPVEHYKNWTRQLPFDNTSSCRGRLIWASQTVSPLDKPPFEELTLQQLIGIPHRDVQHLQCNTRAWLHCKAEPSSFFSSSWPRGGQTARERTESIGVRPSSEAGLQNRPYLYQLWPIT